MICKQKIIRFGLYSLCIFTLVTINGCATQRHSKTSYSSCEASSTAIKYAKKYLAARFEQVDVNTFKKTIARNNKFTWIINFVPPKGGASRGALVVVHKSPCGILAVETEK